MNFDFSEEQKMLRSQLRRILSDRCTLARVRAVAGGGEPFARDVWDGLAGLGVLGAAVPEAYGGAGLSHLETCVAAEEIGRALAPIPFCSSVCFAMEAIMLSGSEEQKHRYLPQLCQGTMIGTAAAELRAVHSAPPDVCLRNGRLYGNKHIVLDGDIADIMVLPVHGDGAVDDCLLVLVDLRGPGVERRTVETLDPTRSHGAISFDGADIEPLAGAGQGRDVLLRLIRHAAVLVAFEQLGGAERCLEIARSYAIERHAFGRAIGSFQAIKHKLADMYVNNQLARSNAYWAAWALSVNADELALAAATARISACDAFHFASQENLQIHGGIGFTWEADCHLFYKRAKLLELWLGGRIGWADRLVAELRKGQAHGT